MGKLQAIVVRVIVVQAIVVRVIVVKSLKEGILNLVLLQNSPRALHRLLQEIWPPI
jgi:hypothetical protein